MATYTENYGLHQWEASDDFLRTDFNTDLGIIDGALGNKAELVMGSYTGTSADDVTVLTVTLGFQPRVVVFGVAGFRYNGAEGSDNNCMALYPGVDCTGTTGWNTGGGRITADGFQVWGRSNYINSVYHYAALK